jgi:hypothetical protein
MTGAKVSDDHAAARPPAIEPQQLTAAAAPRLPLKQLAAGNFHDLDMLLDQLGAPPVFELGNPLPNDKYMPRARVGRCPASHNRFLLREED